MKAANRCLGNTPLVLSPQEQIAVLDSGPADQWRGFYLMPGQVTAQPPIQIFVQENIHLGRLEYLLPGGFNH